MFPSLSGRGENRRMGAKPVGSNCSWADSQRLYGRPYLLTKFIPYLLPKTCRILCRIVSSIVSCRPFSAVAAEAPADKTE